MIAKRPTLWFSFLPVAHTSVGCLRVWRKTREVPTFQVLCCVYNCDKQRKNPRYSLSCVLSGCWHDGRSRCCKCREELQAEAALAAVLKEREEESRRQARIVGQQQQAQHARHAAGNVVRGVPALAGKTRLDILHELQELVNKRCGSTASDGYALIHYCIWKLTLHSSLLPGISSTQPGLGARSRAELPQNTGTIDATATYTS